MYDVNKDLYDYIFNTLGAKYERMPLEVESNLENDREKNLQYLGTYFPRTFTESYKIFGNAFDCFYDYHYFDFLGDTVNILDIGSGTGGQLFGLLQILSERLPNKKINVFSIDGNEDALNIQQHICSYNGGSLYRNSHYLNFYKYHVEFKDNKHFLSYIANNFQNIKFDIVMSFKFLNELHLLGNGVYATTLALAENILSTNGILCLVDVTNKIRNIDGDELSDFLSIIFNMETAEYFINNRENTTLYYALPSCCSQNICNCNNNACFTCFSFPILHQGGFIDKSKVNYKLFLKRGDFFKGFNCHYLTFTQSGRCDSCTLKTNSNICYCDNHYPRNSGAFNPLRIENLAFEDSPFSFNVW